MQEAEYDICIVGGGCVDYFVEVGDFPRRGETIAANTYFNAPGGKGANQAVAAAKLIGKAIFAGQFGKDEAAESIEKHMNAAGVNTQFTRKLPGVKTAVGFITLTESGQNSIIIVGGANTHYSDLTKLPSEFCEAIDRSRIVLLQREIQNEINTLAAVYAKSKGKLVVLDVGGRDEPLAEELLASLDYVSPNETELERLIGTVSSDVSEPIDQIIRSRLFTKYPNLKVLLKLGADGSAVITKDLYLKCQNITKFNEEILKEYSVVDVTGAGDCLMGSFFVRYAQLLGKAPIEEVYTKCMRFGNLSAFLCITQKGCIPAMPDIKTVEEVHKKYLSDLEI